MTRGAGSATGIGRRATALVDRMLPFAERGRHNGSLRKCVSRKSKTRFAMETITFDDRGEYAAVDYSGTTAFDDLKALVSTLLDYSKSSGCQRLLLDVRRSTGEIGITDRYRLGEVMSQIWERSIRLALVVRSDQILPDRFWETVTRNRGLATGVFTDPAAAQDWLTAD